MRHTTKALLKFVGPPQEFCVHGVPMNSLSLKPSTPDRNFVAELRHFNLFGDNMTPYRTESVHFYMLMKSATPINPKP